MKTNVDLKPLERLDFSKVNNTLPARPSGGPDCPDPELLTLDKVQIKKDWDEPEIGVKGILGPVLSIIGSIALPLALNLVAPGLGGVFSGLIKAGFGMAGAFIGGTIGNLISPAAEPSFGNLTSSFRDQPFINSPTFSLAGIQNQTFPDGPIPLIYGTRRTGGIRISHRLETIGDEVFFWGLYALSEGEVDSICPAGLSDLRVNGQPGNNFNSIEFGTRVGTKETGQDTIPGFEEQAVSYPIGTKITNSPSTYTTISSSVIGVIIRISAPGGIYSIDNMGVLQENSVKYRVEYKLNSSGTWIDFGITTITGNKTGTLRHVFEKRGTVVGKYDVRVTRVSQEQNGPRNISTIYWEGIDEITGDEFVYPHTALAWVKIKATNQLSGQVPTITFLVKGIKIKDVTNLGAAARWSQNPADCYYDLITNKRYGLGRFISTSEVNTTQLSTLATYFNTTVDDGDGGTEVRSQMDVVIDTHSDAQQLLVQLMSSFNASPLWSEGLTSLVVDRPAPHVHIFNMGNIVKGSYASSFPDIKKAPNRISIQYANQDNDYKIEPVSVTDETSITSGGPIRTEKIMAAPVTRKSEVYRLANRKINIAKYITRACAFRALPDAVDLQAGDVFLLQHDVPQWGWGGRLESIDGATVVVDQELTLAPATSYVLQARLPDGTLEERAVTNPAETTKVITLASAFSTAPDRMSPYFFGETINKKLFTCVSITMSPDGNRQIAAVEYDANVYGETTLLPDDNASALPTPGQIPPDVENLTLLENPGQPNSVIVSFNIPNPAGSWNHAVIELSSDSGNTYFPYASVDSAADVVIKNLVIGLQYYIRVSSFSSFKIMSANPPTANIAMTGNPFVPPTVRGLEIVGQGNVTTFSGRDVSFQWKKNNPIFGVGTSGAGNDNVGAGPGADVPTFQDYKVEIYVNGSRVRATFTKDNSFRYTEQMNIEDNSGLGARAFQIRVAERSSFNVSGVAAFLDVSNPAPDMSTFTPTLLGLFDGLQVIFSGYTPTDADFQKYEIYVDTSNPPTALAATVDAETKQIMINDLDTNAEYYVRIKPYDVFGVGTPSAVRSQFTLGLELRDMNVALDGIEFSAQNPTANKLYWTAGNISYTDLSGDDQTVAIASGNQLWSSGTMFLYWTVGEGTLSVTTSRVLAFTGNNFILATYKGGDDMTVTFGRVIIDGSDILAGSVTANQLIVSTAVITVAAQIANLIVTNAKIANGTIQSAKIGTGEIKTANIDTAAITSAKIDTLAVTNAKIGNLAVDTLQLAGEAVETAKVKNNAITVNGAAYTGGNINGSAAWTTIQDITITTTGGPVMVQGKCEAWGTSYSSYNEYKLIHSTGAVIDVTGQTCMFSYASDEYRVNTAGNATFSITQMASLLGIYTPSTGSNTFYLQFRNSVGGTPVARYRAISVIELKK